MCITSLFKQTGSEHPPRSGYLAADGSFLQDRDAKATDTFQIHLNIRLGLPLSAAGAGRQQRLPPAPLINIQREKPTCCYKPPDSVPAPRTGNLEPSIFLFLPWQRDVAGEGGAAAGARPGGRRSRFLTAK